MDRRVQRYLKVGSLQERVGQLMDARAREAAFAEAWQFRVEFLRKILTDLEDGSLDLIIIVQQPLGRQTGMWFGLTCGEPCLGQPPFHRIKAGPGHERSRAADQRSEEHTSELQSLMRISYAVFCLKK